MFKRFPARRNQSAVLKKKARETTILREKTYSIATLDEERSLHDHYSQSIYSQSIRKKMIMFTLDNTDGFSQKVLDQMNAEVRERMKKYDSRSKDYKKILEQVEDDVFDEFCNSSFRPSMKL